MNQNFVEYVKSHIKEYLPMEYQNAVVSINEVTKSNDRLLTGLTILSPGERSAPTIYLEALAEQIKAAQDPEIQTMKGWLEEWGVPYDDSMSGMEGMDMGGGMMSEDDMAALDAATGVEATRLFLNGMIAHHQGAVTMAQSVLTDGQNPDVAALAQQIIDGQTAEITTMQDILASL